MPEPAHVLPTMELLCGLEDAVSHIQKGGGAGRIFQALQDVEQKPLVACRSQGLMEIGIMSVPVHKSPVGMPGTLGPDLPDAIGSRRRG